MAKFAVVQRTDVWYCESCDKFYDDDEVNEAGPLYECGSCGHKFAMQDVGSHQCPECNKFASKVSEIACPAGEDHGDELESVEALLDTENGGVLFVSLDYIKEKDG